MSIHPSLSVSEKDKKTRSVLKRTERIRHMQEKGKWKEGDPVFNLPKIKTVKIKIKKEKAEKAEAAVPAEGATQAPAAGAATGAKEAAKASPKAQEKK